MKFVHTHRRMPAQHLRRQPARLPFFIAIRHKAGFRLFLAGVAGLVLSGGMVSCAETTGGSSTLAHVENDRVRVEYDLGRGTFDLIDAASGRAVVRSGHSELETWSSADAACTRSAETAAFTDELGAGRRLTVKCARPNGPTLITQFEVHGSGDSSVVLREGVENTGAAPLRLKEFHPLAGGLIQPEGEWTDIRTLNGDSACNQARVAPERFRNSANNLLLTFKQDGRRHSVALGGLKTADFMKWAQTLPDAARDLRGLGLAHALPGARLVSYLDCGAREQSRQISGPVLHVVTGQPYTFPGQPSEQRFSTIVLDGGQIVIGAKGLDPAKRYAVGFSWWDYDANGRIQSVLVRGKDNEPHVLFGKLPLPNFTRQHQSATELAAVIPAGTYDDGSLRIGITKDAPVANAVVSEVWLWELDKDASLPAEWTNGRAVTSDPLTEDGKLPVMADLEGSDPVGKPVAPGQTYVPEDSFYVDCGTADPFEALEKYGQSLRAATHANPHIYDFPTVCAWYVGVWHTPGAPDHPEKSKYLIATTPGLVEEADKAKESGFTRYSRFAGRLVPDMYRPQNPQGWWDDEHWQKYGYYVAPYDTSQKFGQAMHERGDLAFTYFQPTCLGGGSFISKDFREQHVDWLNGKDVHRTLDYTLPAVQDHMHKVYAAMRGGVDGLMIDYCDDFWAHEASQDGFADPTYTSTMFYREFFKLAKDGLGPDSFLHERNLNQPNNDLTLGIVDLQRTSWDTDKISPEMASRSGLRWYKNRVVMNYDMDSKELTSSWKIDDYNAPDEDGRRMMLTMVYVAASRLLLANSFRDMSPETLHDLSRVLPFHSERKSARPVDAFVNSGWPQVYDFAVNPRWHQVTLYNNALPTKETSFSIPLSGDDVDGGLGLRADKEYYAYDFWNNHFAGRIKGGAHLDQTLRPGEARMLAVHEVEPNPQFISTSRHLMQGYVDMARQPAWDEAKHALGGASKVVGGETYEIVLAMNGAKAVKATADTGTIRTEPLAGGEGLVLVKIDAPENATVNWEVVCERDEKMTRKNP